MKIKLILDDWRKNGDAVNPINECDLFDGDFHSGGTFDGSIELTVDQRLELLAAIAAGCRPVFWVDIDREGR